jgi:signal transduction histidine kinase
MAQFKASKRIRLFERSFIIYLSVLLAALAFISYLGYSYHLSFREFLVRQWTQQLGATLDVTALRIENFSSKFAANLVTVSHNPVIKQRICDQQVRVEDDLNYCPLHDLYELHKSEIDAILLLDIVGNILRRFPVDSVSNTLGQTCLSRVSLERNLIENEVFVSESFSNKRGQAAITISCPVYMDTTMVGILRWMVTYAKIGRNYIDVIQMGEQSHLWLTDEEGEIRYHSDSTMQGSGLSGIIESTSCRVFTSDGKLKAMEGSLGSFLKSNKRGAFTYRVQGSEETLCLYRSVTMLNREWKLFLSLPLRNLSEPIRRHATTTFWMEVLVILLFALFAYIFYLTQKRKAHLETEAHYLSELAYSAEQLNIERHNRLRAAIDGQETERNRIARELHDSLGQYLLAMKVKLQGLLHDRSSAEHEKIESISQLSSVAIDEVKRISENLMPRTLDEFGLSIAARRLCEEASRDSGMEIDFVSYGVQAEAEQRLKTHLYRIIQEALNNAIKHSKANHVDIQLLGNPEQLALIIEDDGVGFDPALLGTNHGNGLKNITDRVRIMGGELELSTNTGAGTSIRIKVLAKTWQNEDSQSPAG